MSERDADAISTIALIAAMADGRRQEQEKVQLARIADQLGGGDYGRLAGQVLTGNLRLADVIARLEDDDSRHEAFETAVAVCYADDVATPAEQSFLAELQVSLGIDPAVARRLELEAEALAKAHPSGPVPGPKAAAAIQPPAQAGEAGRPAAQPLDQLILSTAMLAAALELLPQKMASLAIVPLQGRMVFQVGADYGHELDAKQISDLAAAMGIGAAAQVVEGTVRRLLGGAAGMAGGRLAGGMGRAATSAAFTFATTYAMGHAAKRYYAHGRRIDRHDLRTVFEQLRDEGAGLYSKVERAVRAQAGTIDLRSVLDRLRT